MKKVLLLVLVTFCLVACDKKYTYVEISEEEGLLTTKKTETQKKETFKAKNDSVAIVTAFRKFSNSMYATERVRKELGHTYKQPIDFKLYDSKNRDITYKVDSYVSWEEESERLYNRLEKIKPIITEPVRDTAKIAELEKYFNIKEDEFDVGKRKWYIPKSAPKYVNINGIYCYFQVNDGVASNFRLKIQLVRNEWLFFKKCLFSIDGEAFEYIPYDVKTDHGGGIIWEWFDEQIQGRDMKIIEALANCTSAKIKFEGSKYHQIKDISKNEILNIKRSLDLYKAMGGK